MLPHANKTTSNIHIYTLPLFLIPKINSPLFSAFSSSTSPLFSHHAKGPTQNHSSSVNNALIGIEIWQYTN